MKRLLPLALILSAGLFTFAFAQTTPPAATPAAADDTKLPPPEGEALNRLNKSRLHGEWIEVKVEGAEKPMKCYVVHPERADKAPVVLVIMDGISNPPFKKRLLTNKISRLKDSMALRSLNCRGIGYQSDAIRGSISLVSYLGQEHRGSRCQVRRPEQPEEDGTGIHAPLRQAIDGLGLAQANHLLRNGACGR